MKQLPHSTQAFIHLVALACLGGRPWLTFKELQERLGCHYRTALNAVHTAESFGLILVIRERRPFIFSLTRFAVSELEKTWTH